GETLRELELRRVADRDVAAHRFGAHHAAHARHLQAARQRFDLHRDARRHRQRVVDRRVVAVAVAIDEIPLVVRANVDAAGTLVDDHAHALQPALIPARALHRVDRDLVAAAGLDDDVAGEVRDADASVAADADLAREPVGLLGTGVAATLIRARQLA